MAYATPADLIARFGEREMVELTDRTGAGVPDTSLIWLALADAAAEIDGYLRAHYALPVPDPVPAVLTRIACDIARYLLAAERATDEVRTRYEDARRLLAAIGEGKLQLGLAIPTVRLPGSGGSLEVATSTRARDWGMLS